MNSALRNLPLKVGAVVSSTVIVAMTTGRAAAAAPSCNSADYTVDGVFDLDGYLACLAGGGGGGTVPEGSLPTTGSDMMRIIALGIGATVVGVSAMVAAKRRTPDAAIDALA